MKKLRRNKKRICAGMLAFILSTSPVLNNIPAFFISSEAATYGDTMQAYIKSSGFRQYCIDGMSPNNALGVADRYVYVSPYVSLSEAETGQIFFALLSLEVSQGASQDLNKALNQLQKAAVSLGLLPMTSPVSKDDLKLYLHSAVTRAKYPWVKVWSDNADKLLETAGLLSSSSAGATMGGLVPATLVGHTTPETAVAADGTMSIKFAQDGSDAGFIQSVPLKFSATGEAGSYVSEIPNGWMYVKTDTEITFTNPGNSPTPLYVQFDPIGTRYETAMGTFASARDLYEQCLQLWVLQQCAGQHKKFPRIGVVPAQQHQRLAYVEIALPSSVYYASVGASGVFGTGIFWGQQGFGGNTPSYPSGTSSSGSLKFNCYRHEEDWISTYNTQLTKYDHETGETLEGSSFRLYERFDDKDQVNLERDGAVELYGGTDHETYLSKYLDNPVVWDDYRFVATVTTNEEGYASNAVEHKYHYDKTFCDGHPAPAFVEVPEEEEDEEGEAIVAEEKPVVIAAAAETAAAAAEEEEEEEGKKEEPAIVEEPVVETVVKEEEPKSAVLGESLKLSAGLRHAISLNDSFRFSRELFGGNTDLMNRVIEQISVMSSYKTAVAFLSSKVELNEEKEAVNDFLELLKKYFNQSA